MQGRKAICRAGASCVFAVCAALLGGCASEADKALKEYEIVEQSAIDGLDDAQVCAAASKVRDAYLSEGDASRYESWKLIASDKCM